LKRHSFVVITHTVKKKTGRLQSNTFLSIHPERMMIWSRPVALPEIAFSPLSRLTFLLNSCNHLCSLRGISQEQQYVHAYMTSLLPSFHSLPICGIAFSHSLPHRSKKPFFIHYHSILLLSPSLHTHYGCVVCPCFLLVRLVHSTYRDHHTCV